LNYFSSEGEKVSHIFEHVWKRDEDDNLVFDPEPEAKVKWYTPEGTHVTSIAKTKGHWMSDNRAGWSTQQLVYAEEYSDFVKDFGTHLHKFVELRIKYGTEYWTKQETIDHLKEVSEWLTAYTEKASKWDTNVVAKAKSVQDFLINLNEESLNESVQTLVQSLIEYMKPSDDPTLTILAEIPIKYKTQRGELIQGRIDALTYDDEGNVHIYDYKTSMSVMNE
jgi:ATP-dependent exoDNAse (exonuclease V) beta subunit